MLKNDWRRVGLLLVTGLFAVLGGRLACEAETVGERSHPSHRLTQLRLPVVEIALDSLVLSDSDGPWLDMAGIRIRLDVNSPDTIVNVQRADIDRLTVMRRPVQGATMGGSTVVSAAPDGMDETGGLERRLGPVIVDAFQIASIEIEPAASGLRDLLRARLDGRLTWRGGDNLNGDVSVEVTAPEWLQSSLSVSVSKRLARLGLDVGIETGVNGHWEVQLSMTDGALLHAVVHGGVGRLTINGDTAIDLDQTVPRVNGRMDIQVASHGENGGRLPGLAAWLDAWLPDGHGGIRVQAENRDVRQFLRGELRLDDVGIGVGQIGSLMLSADLADLFGDYPALDIKGQLSRAVLPAGRIDTLCLRGEGRWALPFQSCESDSVGGVGVGGIWRWFAGQRQRWIAAETGIGVDVALNGEFRGGAFTLGSEARFQGRLTAEGDQRLVVDRLQATWEDVAMRLRTPLHASRDGAFYEVRPVLMRVGPSSLGVSARLIGDDLRVQGAWQTPSLQGIPGLEPYGIDAAVRADWLVAGDRRQPDVEAAVTVSNLVVAARSSVPEWLDTLDASLSLSARGMLLDAGAYGRGTNLLRVHGVFPLVVRADPRLLLHTVVGEAYRGWLTGIVPLAWVGDLVFPDDTRQLKGLATMRLEWEDSGEGPRVSGEASIREGAYHDLLMGTRLRDIELQLKGDERGVVIDRGSAKDRGDGRLTLGGRVDFWPWGRWPHHIEMQMERMRLVERDEVTAFADGRLTLAGDYMASRLRGQVNLTPVEIRVPDRLPAMIPSLPVVDPLKPQVATDARASLFPRLALDVTVEAPQRLFVRNRALDTEWQGRLGVTGTVAEPEVEGTLNALHGRFLVLGRRFRLQQGTIRFPGYPVIPFFDATAETDVSGVVARLRLSGTPQYAQWELSSTPSLPEDEVLSRVFFNRGAGASTAGQALRVAQAAEALAGGGRLTDVLDWGRRALRVDRVDFIDPESPDGTARVAVGRYIGDRGFVDIEKDVARSDGGRARIHYDLAPGISLETDLESTGDRGIGLQWQRDY